MPPPKDKTKVKEWKDKIAKTLKGRRCCMTTEFKIGQKPWNFGLKGKGICKANSGSFKKGQQPINYMGGLKACKDGIYIRVKGKKYSYQVNGKQIIVGKYESLARHKYRKAFGEFPKEMIVLHKDGDMLNNNIENLELITRAENLKRNMYKNKKICIICGVEFLARVKKCKTCSIECRKEYNSILGKEYSKTHRQKYVEGNRKYREKNKEKIKKNAKIYREKNKEKIKENQRIYREKKLKEYKKFLLKNETFKAKHLNNINI